MSRVTLLLLAGLLNLLPFNSELVAEDRPNVIVILADDMGYADLSIQGATAYQTPHIDQIFKSGIQFTSGYVTNSVCAPSRAGLITGRMGIRYGFDANIPTPGSYGLDTKEKTIADLMKARGYRTYGIGKWHLGNEPRFRPNERGFDEFVGLLGGSRSYFKVKQKQSKKAIEVNSIRRQDKIIELPEDFYATDFFTDSAIKFIDQNQKQDPGQPFFMYLSYTAPHGPLQPKPGYEQQMMHIAKPNKRKHACLVKNLDDNIGRLTGHLRKLGQLDNTLIVFLSDNGSTPEINTNRPLRGHKGGEFEGGVRVPFAISYPDKVAGGQVCDEVVSSLDFLPTFAGAAGFLNDVKVKYDGVNLMPFMVDGFDDFPSRTLYWRRGGKRVRFMRAGDLKMVDRIRSGKDGLQYLFDLSNDIGEKRDLKTKREEDFKTMREQYADFEADKPLPMGFKAQKPTQ